MVVAKDDVEVALNAGAPFVEIGFSMMKFFLTPNIARNWGCGFCTTFLTPILGSGRGCRREDMLLEFEEDSGSEFEEL